MSAKFKELPAGLLAAFKLTSAERQAHLRASPWYELNKKYEPRKLQRQAARREKYLKDQIALQVALIAEAKQETARLAAILAATNSEIEAVKAATEKAKQQAFMKNLRANQAIKEFTTSLKALATAPTAAKSPVAAIAAPIPSKSAADVLQEMINKKYRLK